MRHPLLSLALVTLVAGCGGTVVFEEDGGEGGAPNASSSPANGVTVGSYSVSHATATSGGVTVGSAATATGTTSGGTSSGGGSTASASGSVSASTGGGPCQTHDDCTGDVCVQGTCARRCEAGQCDACTPGTVCNGCATSSCPDCDDCIAACVPTTEGSCDDDDPCGLDQVCMFPYGYCAPSCESGACADPNMVCSECATGSCCGCENCVSACFALDG